MLRWIIKKIYRLNHKITANFWHVRGFFLSFLFESCERPYPQFGSNTLFSGIQHVRCGKDVQVRSNCYFDAKGGLTFGDYFTCSYGVKILTGNLFPGPDGSIVRKHHWQPVVIGKNVWVGTDAIILPGVTIGDNVIVGAGAIVTKDLPSNGIYAGVPARLVRTIKVESDSTSAEKSE